MVMSSHDALLRTLAAQAEALRDALAMQRELPMLIQQMLGYRQMPMFVQPLEEPELDPPEKEKRPYRPSEPAHRTYAGFKADMLHYEHARNGKVNKEDIYTDGGPSGKTTTRTMEAYGLGPRDWPPSRWPDTPPNGKTSL